MNVEKLSLIGRKQFKYNDDIIINIPTVRQIRDEDYEGVSFWKETNLFTQTPSDMISELDSVNIDFEEISDYELFIFLFLMNKKIENPSKCMLFTNFSFWNLEVCEINGISCLSDENGKVIINESVYNDISKIITMITGHEKTKKKKFGNTYAKKKRIEQDYKQKERIKNQNKEQSNVLDSIILRLVCNTNFPYNFETIQDVTIYDLIKSLQQIDKDIEVSDLMQSRLVGNDLSKLPKQQLSRFIL